MSVTFKRSSRDGASSRRLASILRFSFSPTAEQGDANAQSELAQAYIDGEGIERDYAAAMLWARRSADQGDTVGANNLGALYANGWGVPQDLRAAVLWFPRSAKQGNKYAKDNLLGLAAAGVPEAAAAVQRLRLAP